MENSAEHRSLHRKLGSALPSPVFGIRDLGMVVASRRAVSHPASRAPNPVPRVSSPKSRYLVIRLSSIGDLVHTLPAVSALGETFPDSEICWLVEARYANLIEGNPYVHRVIEMDTLGWRKRLGSAETARQVFQWLGRLRRDTFDTVIDFQGLVKTGCVARLCRARTRVGFARPWLKEPAAGIFYNRHVAAEGRKHAIEEAFALVEHLGAKPGPWRFPLCWDAQDEAYVDRALAGIADFIVINPGGGWRAKRWPPASYGDLVRELDSRSFPEVILSGSSGEEEEIKAIIRHSGSSRARYLPTTIRQFMVLARRSKLFIGGDTGPLHLAAALKVPIVALYGPTDPARNGPFSPDDIVLSTHQPVDHTRRGKKSGYLEGISLDDALRAVRARLAGANER